MIESIFDDKIGYVALERPIEFEEYDIIGYFPYHQSRLEGKTRVPRSIFKYLEGAIQGARKTGDNKFIIVCKDKVHFGTENFVVHLKDCWGSIGAWEDVRDYYGGPLINK